MSYNRFALVYDELMEDVPYDTFVSYALLQLKLHHPQAKTIADIGCGTGTIAVQFAQNGFDVTGVDLSDDMLFIASEKAQEAGTPIAFYQQDMRELEGIGPFDVITIFLDSLNYVTEEDEVKETLERVFALLRPGGLLLFDMHTVFKIKEVFSNQTFAYAGDDVSYIWTSVPSEKENGIYHDLDFFVQDENTGLYERFSESHEQRAYEEEWIEGLLASIGFTIVSKNVDVDGEEHSLERVFYTAQRPK